MCERESMWVGGCVRACVRERGGGKEGRENSFVHLFFPPRTFSLSHGQVTLLERARRIQPDLFWRWL